MKHILLLVGGISLIIAGYICFAPQHWYLTVPGVQVTGPLNVHFARDVALAFLASGMALFWAGAKGDKSAAVFGSSWLVLHALFHIWIWLHRGAPLDMIALTNLMGIQLPAFAALFAALNLPETQGRGRA